MYNLNNLFLVFFIYNEIITKLFRKNVRYRKGELKTMKCDYCGTELVEGYRGKMVCPNDRFEEKENSK